MAAGRVPVIDLAPYRAGDPAGTRDVVRAVAAACEQAGVLLITGHGVSAALVRRVFEVACAFFDLPLEEKLRFRPSEPKLPRGYSPFASKNLARTYGLDAPPDLREQYFIGPLEDWAPRFAHIDGAARFYAPNIWPDRPQQYRCVLTEFYRAQERLARDLMRIFALALALPETWFDDKIDRHFSTLPVNFYPAPPDSMAAGQLRAGAHTDFGSLTILAVNDAPGGLQVLFPPADWRDVRPAPGQFVVNLGDMMARWTNERWPSTVHRVVNPPREAAAHSRRQSVGFFLHPNYDAEIACIPSCCGPDRPARHAPIMAGEQMRLKLESRVVT